MEKALIGLSIVVALVTIWTGITQYKATSARTAMAPFLEKQLSTYSNILKVVGELSASTNSSVFQAKVVDFWALYYGPLALVEDYQVEAAMVSFGELLNEPNIDIEDPKFRNELTQRSLNLAAACRSSISKSWSLDLAPLEKSLIYQVPNID